MIPHVGEGLLAIVDTTYLTGRCHGLWVEKYQVKSKIKPSQALHGYQVTVKKTLTLKLTTCMMLL